MSGSGSPDQIEIVRLLEENAQLRDALESALEGKGRITADRDRLLQHVAAMEPEAGMAHASRTDEELRAAYEQLHVLKEELEVANTHLQEANGMLEERVAARTCELTHANSVLRHAELRLTTLVNGIPQFIWQAVDHGQWTWSSDQWTAYTGLGNEESRGLGWLRAFHPEDRKSIERAWSQADSRNSVMFEARIRNGRDGHYRYFKTQASPVRTPDGKILEWLGASTDIDDILRLQEQQAVLVDELQHRTRNLMAVVQAVMVRTLRNAPSLEEFRRCIEDRLAALARVQGLLSRRGLHRISFDQLLRAELSSHVELDAAGNGKQVSISGPADVPLPSSLVQTFALALHELATNAVKYGALSQPTGMLDVQWAVREATGGGFHLHVDWRESGVAGMPAQDAAPRGGGYGRELIERALPYQLGASTSYRFTPDGVHCTITVKVADDRKIMETING